MSTLATLLFWLMMTLGVKVPMSMREAAPPCSSQTATESSDDGSAVSVRLESAVAPQISNGF